MLSLLFIDIDHFKAYNDHYGHQTGDEALRAVAHCISTTCIGRPGDHVARYGGEEFVALLPETGTDGALFVAERVRRAIQDLHLEHVNSPFGHVTVSIGVSTTGDRGITDACALVKAADDAVYQAKELGRNRVCTATLHDARHAAGTAGPSAQRHAGETRPATLANTENQQG